MTRRSRTIRPGPVCLPKVQAPFHEVVRRDSKWQLGRLKQAALQRRTQPGMATISTLARQPKGIPVGGQFAALRHCEAEVSLGRREGSAPTEESVLAAAAEHLGPGIRRRLAETVTEGGRALFLQRCDALYNGYSPFVVDRSTYGPTPEQCDALAALGYVSVNQFAPEQLKNVRGLETLAEHDVGPDRLEAIGRLPTQELQWSSWERDAYLHAPLDRLEGVIADQGMTTAEKYVATVDLLGMPINTARARKAIEAKIEDRALIEADTFPIPDLVDLRAALPESKRNAGHIVGLARKGITGAHLRAYGAKACEQYTGPELEAAGLAPKRIRSFLTSGVHVALEDMARLEKAGYSSGQDLKLASQAMGTSDAGLLATARQYASGEQLATFSGALASKLTVQDAKAISTLAQRGVTEPAQLRPYTSWTHAPANQFCNRTQSILSIQAGIIEAGISAPRLGQMQRAGIPLDRAAHYVDSLDLWADGKKYRDVYQEDQVSRLDGKWVRDVTPWAFTERSYARGLTF